MITLITLNLLASLSLPLSASVTGETDPDLFYSLIRVFSILFIILALLFTSFYLTKGPLKNLKKKIGLKERDEIIRVLDITNIAPKKSISVVDVAGHIIVVGITANDIIPLARLGNRGAIEIPGSAGLVEGRDSDVSSILNGTEI